MRLQRCRTTLLFVAVLVAGCSPMQSEGGLPGAISSNTATSNATTRVTTGPLRSVSRELLYAAVVREHSLVAVYAERGPGRDKRQIGSITKGIDTPLGLAVDNNANLYVGNSGNSTVTVYARAASDPFETLTGAGYPAGITVGHDGTVYVANHGAGKPVTGASILEYPKGQTTPSKTIPIADGSFPFGLALDSSGNLFATITQSSNYRSAVFDFAPGSTHGKNLRLRGLAREATGIVIDKHNDLLIADGKEVLVYPPGVKRPSQRIGTHLEAYDIAINTENTEIWATYTSFFGAGRVLGFSYPSGRLLDDIRHPVGYKTGVAVSPV